MTHVYLRKCICASFPIIRLESFAAIEFLYICCVCLLSCLVLLYSSYMEEIKIIILLGIELYDFFFEYFIKLFIIGESRHGVMFERFFK